MRRSLAVVCVVLLCSLPGVARAGGSVLEVTEGSHVEIGHVSLAYAGAGSVVSMRGTFTPGQQASVRAGPWYAYLRPDKGGSPRVLLGEVNIQGDAYPYIASVTFEVPSVDAGYYWVDVCDLGCNQGVGDLVGGTIVLAPSESEAQLIARGMALQWVHQSDVHRIDVLKEKRQGLEAALSDAKATGRAADLRASTAQDQADAADAAAADLQVSVADVQRERDAWRIVSLIALLSLFVGGIWAILPRRSRRPTGEPRQSGSEAEQARVG